MWILNTLIASFVKFCEEFGGVTGGGNTEASDVDFIDGWMGGLVYRLYSAGKH